MPLDFSTDPVAPGAPTAAPDAPVQPGPSAAPGPRTPFSSLPVAPKWSDDPGERVQQIGPVLKFDGSPEDNDLQNQWHDAYSQYVQQNGLPRRTMQMLGSVGLPGLAKGVMQSIVAPAKGVAGAFSKASNQLWSGHPMDAMNTTAGAAQGVAAGVGDALHFAGDVGMGAAEAGLSAFGKGNPAMADYAAESALTKMKIDKKYNDFIADVGQRYSSDPESFEGMRPVGALLAAGKGIAEGEAPGTMIGSASAKAGDAGAAAVQTAKGIYQGAEKLPGVGYAFRVLHGAGNKLAEGAEAQEENPYTQVGKGLIATGPKAVKNMIGGGVLAGAASNPGDEDPVGQGIAAALGYTAAAELPELAQSVYNTPIVQGAVDSVRNGIKAGVYAPADAINAVKAKVGGAVLRAQTLRQWSNQPTPGGAKNVTPGATPSLQQAAIAELPRAEVPLVPASSLGGMNLSMTSPNTGTIDFPGAVKALDSDTHQEAVKTVAAMAPKGADVNGRSTGVWNGGAENTILTKHPDDITPEQQTVFAAQAGKALNQISTLNFRSGAGDHVLYEINFPKATMESAHKQMLDAGLTDSTLSAKGNGITAYVLDTKDPSRPVQPGIEKLASSESAPDIIPTRGTGEFVGAKDWNAPDARQQAQGIYDSILQKAGIKGEQEAVQHNAGGSPAPGAAPIAASPEEAATAVPQGNAGAQAQVGPAGEPGPAAPAVAGNAPLAAPGGPGVSSDAAAKATYSPSNRPEAVAPGTPPTPGPGLTPEDRPIIRHAVFDYLLRGVRAGSKSAGDNPAPAPVKVSDLKPGDTFSGLGRVFKVFPSSEPNQVVIHFPEGDFDFAVNKSQVIYPDPGSINNPVNPVVEHTSGTNVSRYGLDIGGTKGMTVENRAAAVKPGESPLKNNAYLYPGGNLRNLFEMGTAPSAASYANRTFALPSKRGEVPYAQHTLPLAAAARAPATAPLAAGK